MKPLYQAMAQWDGKSATDIEKVYQQFSQQGHIVEDCLDALDQQTLQLAATWLLKHAMEQDQLLSEAECLRYYQSITLLSTWQSKLHLLQSMPYMLIDHSIKNDVVESLTLFQNGQKRAGKKTE